MMATAKSHFPTSLLAVVFLTLVSFNDAAAIWNNSNTALWGNLPMPPTTSSSDKAVLPPPRPDSEADEAWPHHPIYLRAGPGVAILGDEDRQGSLPLGAPIEFESDVFVGRILIRLKDVPSHRHQDHHEAYFDGRKRYYQCVVQGRFKEPDLKFSDVFFGDVYEKPFHGIPKGWIMKGFQKFMQRMNPGIILDLTSDRPRIMGPMGSCQEMRIDMPGQEPDIIGWDTIEEDTTLFGKGRDFASSAHRRKQLSKPNVASTYAIDPEKVYTFHIYDHSLDFASYEQDLGIGMKVDLTLALNGQPLALSALTRDERSVFRFELWHEKLLKSHDKVPSN